MANRWRPVKLKRFDIPGHPNGMDRTTVGPYRSMSPLDTILIYQEACAEGSSITDGLVT